ncbi:hypothetical protein N0V88_001083 [Collariella sp. IMI 366227]|nr:hypothetical protein N0V88_001083 [Collariella sp. IMI 366227]
MSTSARRSVSGHGQAVKFKTEFTRPLRGTRYKTLLSQVLDGAVDDESDGSENNDGDDASADDEMEDDSTFGLSGLEPYDIGSGLRYGSPATGKDVIINAFASVNFLRHLGKHPFHASKIGIDNFGRLTYFQESWNKEDFCDMVSELEERMFKDKAMERIRRHLKAYQVEDLTDGEGRAVEDLENMVGFVMGQQTLNKTSLKPVLEMCKKAIQEVDAVLSKVVAFRKDLLDAGTMTIKRLNEFKDLDWLEEDSFWQLENIRPDDMGKVMEDLSKRMWRYQRTLGVTMKLHDELERTINNSL